MCFDRGPLEQTAPNLHHLYTLTSTLLNSQNGGLGGVCSKGPYSKVHLNSF